MSLHAQHSSRVVPNTNYEAAIFRVERTWLPLLTARWQSALRSQSQWVSWLQVQEWLTGVADGLLTVGHYDEATILQELRDIAEHRRTQAVRIVNGNLAP